VRVEVDVPDELAPVLADSVRLDQVLTNLLDNARAYAEASPVQLVARQAGAGRRGHLRAPLPALLRRMPLQDGEAVANRELARP
jgi:signal transduction histidine kinase